MDSGLQQRLTRWLEERGIEGDRRVVRATANGILVSKFPEGFAAHLHESIERLGALFDDERMRERVAATATSEPATPRVETWHNAALAILRDAQAAGTVTAAERAEVEAGVDSVAALLDTALWTGPTWTDDTWTPAPGEVSAFRDALDRMEEANGLFARHYGTFEGLPVENHCPGVSVARRLLQQAWRICTGLEVPAAASG